jgi:hypothetical protein
MRPKEIMY